MNHLPIHNYPDDNTANLMLRKRSSSEKTWPDRQGHKIKRSPYQILLLVHTEKQSMDQSWKWAASDRERDLSNNNDQPAGEQHTKHPGNGTKNQILKCTSSSQRLRQNMPHWNLADWTNYRCSYIFVKIWYKPKRPSTCKQYCLEELTSANLQQQIITKKRKSLNILLWNTPDVFLEVGVDNQLESLFNSNQPPNGAKLNLLVKHSHFPMPIETTGNNFSPFAFDKVDWKQINDFVKHNPFNPYCLSNVDLMLDL